MARTLARMHTPQHYRIPTTPSHRERAANPLACSPSRPAERLAWLGGGRSRTRARRCAKIVRALHADNGIRKVTRSVRVAVAALRRRALGWVSAGSLSGAAAAAAEATGFTRTGDWRLKWRRERKGI